MNHIVLIGRLTRDPEVRVSQSGKSVARFTLAVDRRFSKDTDFISCVAFGKTAEFIEKYTKKGTKIAVEGRLETGSYEKNGVKHYTTTVVVENVEFAESKQVNQDNQGFNQGFNQEEFSDVESELPFL